MKAVSFLVIICLRNLLRVSGQTEPSNVVVVKSYQENGFGFLSVLQVTWQEPQDLIDLSHFLVHWSLYSSSVQPQWRTPRRIDYDQSKADYNFTLDYIYQGQCYLIYVSAVGYDGYSRGNSATTTVASNTAVPYNMTFDGNGTQAKITWKMQGSFSVEYYYLEVIAANVKYNDTFQLNSGSATERYVRLVPGTYYQAVQLFVYSIPECEGTAQSQQPGMRTFKHLTAPPTPFNVTLSHIEGTVPDMMVTWTLDNSFKWFWYIVDLRAEDGNNKTFEGYLLVEEPNTVTLNYTYTAVLSHSETYQATVQVVSHVLTPYLSSHVSLPSNKAVTIPNHFYITRIIQENGNVSILWFNPTGGEAIDDYLLHVRQDDRSRDHYYVIKHHHGVDQYWCNISANSFVHGVYYEVSVAARNGAGNGSTPYTGFIVPSKPSFNVTIVNLTTMNLNDLTAGGLYEGLLVECQTHDKIVTSIRVSNTTSSIDIEGLVPYTQYTVSVYSLVKDFHGHEVRSSPNTKHVLVFVQEFCEESNATNRDGISASFPKTQAGYANTSSEKCSLNTENAGNPLARRSCGLDLVWSDPVFLSSCGVTLEDLASANVTSDEERQNIAADLTVLTANATSLNADDISLCVTALQSVTETENFHQNISALVVEVIGNLLGSPEEELASSGSASSLLQTLDTVVDRVALDDDDEFRSTSSSLSVSVVQTSAKNASGLGYFEKYNPSTAQLGFSQGQFEISNSSAAMRNMSSIWLPSAVVEQSPGRVGFYAFLDNIIFQVSESPPADQIPPDAPVLSNIILSASLNGTPTKLSENVTIKFNYAQAICPADRSGECGEYLCGFWNETDSVWSRDGCTMTQRSDDVIECECDHLTNFASLFAYGGADAIVNNFAFDLLTYIGSSISLLGSLSTIVCLLVVRNSRQPSIPKRTSFVMINLAASLTLLNASLLITFWQLIIDDAIACAVVAIFLHFSLFAALLWTTVEAIYICIGVTKPIYYRTKLSYKKVCVFSSLLGWGIPALFVGLSAAINFSSYQREYICWIYPDMTLWLIIIPAAIVLTLNTIVYVIVVKSHVTRKKVGDSDRKHLSSRKSVSFSVSVFILFGITWMFGFLLFDSNTANVVFAYVFTITNSLQGLFVFLLFVVRNPKIRKVVKDVTTTSAVRLHSSYAN